QSVGMMRAFAESAEVRAVFDEASSALGQDLWTLVEQGPAEELNSTVNTQPVMLTAGYAVYRAWRAAGGPEPDFVAGHSLGEYTALVVASALAFRDAVPLVRLRAQAMQEAVAIGEGAMAAILGLDDDALRAACGEAAQGQVVEPVNFNAPSQVVIAGHKAAVERGMASAKARHPAAGERAVPLVAPQAGGGAPGRAPRRDRRERAAHSRRQQRGCRDRVGSAAHTRRAGAAGVRTGALGRAGAAPGRRRGRPRRRMRAGEGAGGAHAAHRRAAAGIRHHRSRIARADAGEGALMSLEGKVALVTGASRGIGKAIALELA